MQPSAGDVAGRRILCSAFSVGSVTLSHILKDTDESIHNLPPPILGHARHIPCVPDFPTYEDGVHHNGILRFEIAEHLSDEIIDRLALGSLSGGPWRLTGCESPMGWRETNAGQLRLGRKGDEVSYPTALLNPEQHMVSSTAEDPKIRERNDIGVLEMTLENVWTNEGWSKQYSRGVVGY